MAIKEKETIISLDFSFSSSGSSHSASVNTVLNAKDLGEDESELGSLIGSKAGRTTFSNPNIQALLKNFIEVERTVSKDANQKTISRKYQDITSLKLKSHCFVVRGRDSHPQDLAVSAGGGGQSSRISRRNETIDGTPIAIGQASAPASQFSPTGAGKYATIPYFSEVAGSPIKRQDQKFPYRQPRKAGAVILVGDVYNEESSVSSDGTKTSLVYQDGLLKEELSHNQDNISAFYKKNPDLSNYNLKFGYTLAEARSGFGAAGIQISGLPESSGNQVLFDVSGSLESVLSAIASKYGYYWFVDPYQSGLIRFINSSSASQLSVTNPLTQPESVQAKYSNASFTENFITPKIVNAFSSTIEKQEQTFEFGDGQRYTRFDRFDASNLIAKTDVNKTVYQAFYGAYLAGRLQSQAFDVLSILATKEYGDKISWGKYWKESEKLEEAEFVDFEQIVKSTSERKRIKEAHKKTASKFDLEKGKFLQLNKRGEPFTKPSKTDIIGILTDSYNLLFNSIYTTKRIGRFKAKRMQWGSSPMNISGPHLLTTGEGAKIKDVDQLQSLDNLLQRIGKPDLSLNELFDETGNGEYGFIGTVGNNQKQMGDREKKDIDFELLNDENYVFITVGLNNKVFLGVTEDLKSKVKELITASIGMFEEALEGRSKSSVKSMKAYYSRAKRPTDEAETEETKEQEEAEARRQAGLDALAQKLDEIGERFDIRYFSLKTNGASGEPTSPVNLDVKNGKISDVLALETSNSYSIQPRSSQSSSRTIVGLSLPTRFKITLSSISINLGGSGVTTTINESTKILMPLDDTLIIDGNSKASVSKNFYGKFSASQKNFLGL